MHEKELGFPQFFSSDKENVGLWLGQLGVAVDGAVGNGGAYFHLEASYHYAHACTHGCTHSRRTDGRARAHEDAHAHAHAPTYTDTHVDARLHMRLHANRSPDTHTHEPKVM